MIKSESEEIPSCPHCYQPIMCGDVVRAVYSVVTQHHVIGMYAKARGSDLYIHRECFEDLAGLSYLYDPVQDVLVMADPQIEIGHRRSPCVCASCSESINEGDVVWSLTYGRLSVSPSKGAVFEEDEPDPSSGPFPDTYICSTCADTFVYGEG